MKPRQTRRKSKLRSSTGRASKTLGPRICIATTLKHPDASFESWIRYHQVLGFEKLYIFFDDPNDRAIELAKSFSFVECIRCDDAFRKTQAASTMTPEILPMRDINLGQRQILNLEVAIRMATQEGFDWIFHIDCDELIDSKTDIRGYLRALPPTVNGVTLINHEALPISMDIQDCFAEVTTFKTNQYWLFASHSNCKDDPDILLKLIREKKRFVPVKIGGVEYPSLMFHSYANGKSAARLSSRPSPDVHYFTWKVEPGASQQSQQIVSDQLFLYHYANSGFVNCLRRFEGWGSALYIGVQTKSFDLEQIDIRKHGLFEVMRRDYIRQDWSSFENHYKKYVQAPGRAILAAAMRSPFVHVNERMAALLRSARRVK